MDINCMHASSVEKSQLSKVFSVLMAKRSTLLEELITTSSCCRPGPCNLTFSLFETAVFVVNAKKDSLLSLAYL